ncbi:L-Fucosyltransferase [Caenorhabditis elegans]|uniref:L-Fucosyltransferase n=1 Tax=Caenorhabditis elegans TaxID=6239 RepID=O61739_CAEEL|nr:L-Fucosyltransferase [Caenorhabditis elegans]CCD61299.1 L-Fucosyltransferase [Caenorhabditis elegans]|eukprot:NP_492814.2 L-Fucosyltransferase [Caenorhabditis elegans]
MTRFSVTRSLYHSIFIGLCVYILFLFNLSKTRLTPEERPATYMKKNVFYQSGNEATLDNCPWPISNVENVINRVSVLENSGKRYIFSDFGYSQGIGNLMFQVAGLLSIARETGSILLIPSTTTLRRAFDFETTFNDSIQFVGEDLSRQLAEDLNASKITLTSCCAYRNLSTILFNDSRIIERIDGYFQNFRYFHPDSQKIVKKLFTFMDPVRKRVDEFLENVGISLTVRNARVIETNVANDDQALELPEEDAFAKTMMVGVHIRHGMDISMNSRNRIHGHVDTPIEYYKRAIQQISKIYENVAFIICSDNVAWARRNLKLGKETLHFFCPGPREVDMAILKSCDSVIISTGTFGWWSAYLNVNASPDVYYYKHWPAPGSVMEKMTNKTEYFLKSWTALE